MTDFLQINLAAGVQDLWEEKYHSLLRDIF